MGFFLRRLPIVPPDDGAGPFAFPPGFLWGTATADHQIEHAQDDSWTTFEKRARAERKGDVDAHGRPKPGHIAHVMAIDDEALLKKADFDTHMDDDVARAAGLGNNAFRFSISWARLFPRADMTSPDDAGLAFYDRLFDALARHHLQPCVTLFHWPVPAWLDVEQDGKRGLERADAVADFRRFVDVITARWGKRVSLWCTLNEPMVVVYQGYLEGLFPPNERRGDPKHAAPVAAQLLRMHATAYASIKAQNPSAQVGVAQHVRDFMAWRNAWPLDGITAGFIERAFMLDFLDAIETGVFKPTMTGIVEEIPGLKGTQDYIGVNYYGRYYVKAGLLPGKYEVVVHDPDEPGEEKNDLGWGIDETGFVRQLVNLSNRYRGKPFYILENGTADGADDDRLRQRFLVRHVQALWHAIQKENVDVRGYFFWTLLDNWEWAEGFDGRFGLHRVEFAGPHKFRRTARPSAEVFRSIATANALPADVWRRYTR